MKGKTSIKKVLPAIWNNNEAKINNILFILLFLAGIILAVLSILAFFIEVSNLKIANLSPLK